MSIGVIDTRRDISANCASPSTNMAICDTIDYSSMHAAQSVPELDVKHMEILFNDPRNLVREKMVEKNIQRIKQKFDIKKSETI